MLESRWPIPALTARLALEHRARVPAGWLALFVQHRWRTLHGVRELRRLNDAPIVIGGCGRAGTTLLLAVLSCHPQVHTIGTETSALCPLGYTPLPELPSPIRWDRLVRSLLEEGTSPEQLRWCEKTPRNVRVFPRLLEVFGDRTRFLHIVRDGRDVVTSHHPRDPDRYHVRPERWVADTAAGLAVTDPRVLTIRYEDLVLDFECTVRQLCDFVNLSFVPEFLGFPTTARLQDHPAWPNGVRPVSPGSIGRWRDIRYKPLVERLLATPGAAALLRQLDYT